MPTWLLPSVALFLSVTAATTDLRTGRIPNWLTIPAMVLGLAIHACSSGTTGLLGSLVGLAVCAAGPGVIYQASRGRGIGGGDLKLFGALGTLLGPTQGLEAQLSAFVLVATYALFALAYRGALLKTLVGALRVLIGLVSPGNRANNVADSALMSELRMGPAIAAGVATVIVVPYLMRWLAWLA